VLHGVGPDDVGAALATEARPVLNTAVQVARWKEIAPDGPCDVMIDTGMNRLGLRVEEAHLLDGLAIETLMSHLACADEDSPMNAVQRDRFAAVAAAVKARRYSLANSAGVCLGPDYAFDLVRPGLALYGGVPREEALGHIRQVAYPEAEVVQRRTIKAGETCGYGATWTAQSDTEAAIVNIGYADGYLRSFAGRGSASADGASLPLIGRVSMDLIAVDVTAAPELKEGDWVTLDYDLPTAAEASGLSQYELLTGLSERLERRWT
jgi:alanine racemase